ncbi:hypothetical protein Enr10x_43260 [Gimesia panareensis]|uniref:Zinc finger/thioredoxin putative domain-containing protein n=1 Tax=Gimesia panareensis TaxID=2527978 RepID=A0A517QBG4_9PLAN|nr:hypothetical protein [Gimesia panareensis]QDT28978.1 hypothetical protein Enr10x_43260 [Gimesia panareensis]
MSIIIECPGCGTRFRCKDRLAGRKVSCLVCQQGLRVPSRAIPKPQTDPEIPEEPDFPEDAFREAPWVTPPWSTDSATALMTQRNSSTSCRFRAAPAQETKQNQTGGNGSAPHPVSLLCPALLLIALVSSGIWLVLFLFGF